MVKKKKNDNPNTHKVLDFNLTKETGRDVSCFIGTYLKCVTFIKSQPKGRMIYRILPINTELA